MFIVIHIPLIPLKGEGSPFEGALPDKLEFNHINRFGTFWALFSIKADIVTFGKTFKATALNRRMVDKNVSIVFSSNEAKTFAVVEPLHCSLCHFVYLLIFKTKISEGLNKKSHKAKSLCGLL
jgi:4-aminobutyrate aminotransferase-like enzyme